MQRRLCRLASARASTQEALSQMNRSGSLWEAQKLRGLCGQNRKSSGADRPLKDSFTRRGSSHHLILTPLGGLVTAGPCLRTQKLFCTFITKQVIGWCGCNSKLSLWEEKVINTCPQCGCEKETSKQLIRCTDPGCRLQLQSSIETIMDILDSSNVKPALADIIETYLLSQGHRAMADYTQRSSKFWHVAISIDNLRWDCFVEGWLPSSLIDVIKPMLR